MLIPFNRPSRTGNEEPFVSLALNGDQISGDGIFSQRCREWFEQRLNSPCLMTPSCTHALEMAALLVDIQPGDEVIMPSYTFVSTANAFVLRGADVVFVDIRPDTMNIDENLIEGAITEKTKVIVPVHYAGVSCEMDQIMEIAIQNNIHVVEDAAQAMMATYKDKALGTIGSFGTYSFHETKNYTSGGEGGLLIINDERLKERAEIIREKGTNRSQFFRGMVDKYSWVDVGSSFLPSELQAAYLWAQLESANQINERRLEVWNQYKAELEPLQKCGVLTLPHIPNECQHNAHMFYIKVEDLAERGKLLKYLKANGVHAVFHYVPLHTATAGIKFGRFHGEDRYTTSESDRLIRLPLFYGISEEQVRYVIDHIYKFFGVQKHD